MVRGKGTGFVTPPGPGTDDPKTRDRNDDIVVERQNLDRALDGDTVAVELLPEKPGERRQGRVTKVLERAHLYIIGTVKEVQENGAPMRQLVPDNRRIHVRPLLPDASGNDVDMKVVAELTEWPQPHLAPHARITEVLGRAGDHETEMRAIIRGGGFAKDFPAGVQAAAEELHETQAAIFAAALADEKRRDMRGVTTMTIDPADAKDFDDALSIEQLPNGNVSVGIHIADVSHYVIEGEPLDVEARERATSVYLVDRVIPMLPEVLSNDLCSLRPDTDRLAFSAVFELNSEAEVQNAWYGQTVIHSDKRFSYEDAQAVLDNESGDYLTELQIMRRLSRLLRAARFKAGAIAFEQPEIKFKLDENGAPIEAYQKHRTETMMMIEDFMLLCNREVATYVNEKAKQESVDHPYVYRIHDNPNPDKIEELATFVHALGHEFETHNGNVSAKAINRLMKEVEGTPEENLIKTAAIRSMAKAIYSTKNIGHFGLAFNYYSHFTSPIRRYPDLLAHRLLRKHLDGVRVGPRETATLEQTCTHASEKENEAVRAERDSIKFKQVEYMVRHVGKEFTAVITGVTDWGIYVQEQNTLSEGMVRLATINGDYFEHEPKKYRIRGRKTGKTYRLGDEVRVTLVRADMEERQIDFELVQ